MSTSLKLYSSERQDNHNRIIGLILGTYQPDADKPEQGLITTTDGRSFKAKLMEQVKNQYCKGLDLSKPMLFTVQPKLWFGVGFILAVVRIAQPENDEFNQSPKYFSIAKRVLAKFSGLY